MGDNHFMGHVIFWVTELHKQTGSMLAVSECTILWESMSTDRHLPSTYTQTGFITRCLVLKTVMVSKSGGRRGAVQSFLFSCCGSLESPPLPHICITFQNWSSSGSQENWASVQALCFVLECASINGVQNGSALAALRVALARTTAFLLLQHNLSTMEGEMTCDFFSVNQLQNNSSFLRIIPTIPILSSEKMRLLSSFGKALCFEVVFT